MNRLVSLAIACLLASKGFGQDSTITVSHNKYVQVDVGIGYLRTNMSSINTLLQHSGFKPMKENYNTLSLSSTYFVNRLLFRAEFSLILPNHVDQAIDRNTEFKGYTVSAGIGYALVQRPKFGLYPYIGITGFNTKLQFNDLTPVADMNELLNTPRKNATIRFSNAALDLGAQLEKIITLKNNKWDCPQNNKYMTMGIRLGYNWSPGINKARFNGTQLRNGPEYSFEGPYIKLVLGTGTKIRQFKWQ
jgi:hypothetical protein